MNLKPALRSRHTTEEDTTFVNSSGKPFAIFKGNTGENSFTAEYEILRVDLAGLFMEATEGLANVRYMSGDSIKSLEQSEKDVDVSFTGGSQDTFDLVVAADGGISTTRPMILDEQVLKDSYNFIGQYIAFFSIPSKATDPKMWQWYNTPKGLCLMMRPASHHVYCGRILVHHDASKGAEGSSYRSCHGKGSGSTETGPARVS
jgi:2-polyprenyl-6-methoxyphenol hydroxylase-like FAD-dependent oxidoreductase